MTDFSSVHVQALKYLGAHVPFEIDRPRGTRHPDYPALVYEIDYGFIPHTRSNDGEEIDAYILGGSGDDLEERRGLCVGVILRYDGDDKLLVAADPKFETVSPQMVWELTAFQERFFWPDEYVGRSGCHCRFSDRGVDGMV